MGTIRQQLITKATIILIISSLALQQSQVLVADTECINCEAKSCSTGPKCLRCKSGFGLKSGSVKECEQCKIADRKKSDEKTNQCVQCDDRYILVGDECKECGITEKRKDNTCEPCEPHTILNGNACESCKLNEISTELNKCKVCDVGFKQENNACVKCPVHFYSIPATNECKECKENEVVVDNACKACGATEGREGDTCKECGARQIKGDKGVCVDCKERETVDRDGNKCVECPAHQIREGNVCKECQVDEISEGNVCKEIGSNQIQNNNVATDCKDNQYVKDNTCQDCGANCQKCVPPDGKCEICLLGKFGLDSAGGKECKDCQDSKCQNCSKDYEKCEECDTGTFLSVDQCKTCINDCEICTSETNCFKCSGGKFVKENKCVEASEIANSSVQCAADCTRCSTYLQCDACNKGFFVTPNKLCQQCSSNCQECNFADRCAICFIGYEVNDSGYCVPRKELDSPWKWWHTLLAILGVLGILGAIGYCIFKRKQDEFRSSNMLLNQNSYPYKRVEDDFQGRREESIQESAVYGNDVPQAGYDDGPIDGGFQMSQYIGF